MGTKRDAQEQRTREVIAASTKAGIALGFDRAIRLLEALEAAWGGDDGYAAELQKMRDRVVAEMQATVDEVAS